MKKIMFAWVLFGAAPLLGSTADAATRAGLWETTALMQMGAGMPQIPPAQLEQMKRMGIKIPLVEPVTTTYCVSPEMAARDDVPNAAEKQGCKATNVKKSAAMMSADMVCDGQFKGKGHMEATLMGDSAYDTTLKITGTSSRSPMPIDMSIHATGKWLAADCGAVKPMQ